MLIETDSERKDIGNMLTRAYKLGTKLVFRDAKDVIFATVRMFDYSKATSRDKQIALKNKSKTEELITEEDEETTE